MTTHHAAGFWGLDLKDTGWLCPECNQTSACSDWEECRPFCEDCGDHDGIRCPKCGEEYDHVWGVDRLVEANS